MIDTDSAVLDDIIATDAKRKRGDWDNSLPIVSVDIPATVIIHCPKTKNHMSLARNCKKCSRFNGVVQTAYNDETVMQWDHKYSISCAFPVERKCSTIYIEVDQ